MSAPNEHNLKAFTSVKVLSSAPTFKGFTSSIALLFNGCYKFESSYAVTTMGMWQPDEYFSVHLVARDGQRVRMQIHYS